MYLVKLRNRDGGECFLHDPRDSELLLIDPVLSMELNRSGAFSFSISPTHPHVGKIRKMSSEIEVLRDGKIIYTGRPLNESDDMDNVAAITCEGVLSYLLDSVARPFEYKGSPKGLFQKLLNDHNAQVDEWKRFKLGNVTVTDSNDYINRSNSSYGSTLDAIEEKLIKTHGGYLRVRFEADGRYLDYLSDYEHTCSQMIEFGENLLDLNKYIDPDDLVTAVIPLGAETDEDGINGVKKRVNITSVNGGLDYVVDETAAAEFGFICRTVEFDDVTLPQNLKAKGQAYLEEHKGLIHSLELSAVDLHLLQLDVESVLLGDWIRVKSPPHGLDSLFLVSKLELNLADPGADVLSLGKTFETMTGSTGKIQNEISGELQKTMDGISAKLVVADQSILAEVARATSAESDLDADLSSLRVDIEGITFSVSNGSASSRFTMKVGETTITSPAIRFTGMVTFADLSGSGTTEINGDNLTTGTINILEGGGVTLQGTAPGGGGGGFAAAEGNDGKQATYGAKMYGLNGDYYCIATDAGVCLNGPSAAFYVSGGNIHASTAISEGSDRNLKHSISHDLEAYRAFFSALKPAAYKFKAGTSDRLHTGFIAQEVEDALHHAGLAAQDFAGLVIEQKEDPNGNPVQEYGLRYSEFVSLNTYMLQQAFREIEALKKRITELEDKAHGTDR